MFPRVYFGRHLLRPEVEYSRAEGVHVQTATPLDIYADGEFVCETPAEISVAAGALQVICFCGGAGFPPPTGGEPRFLPTPLFFKPPLPLPQPRDSPRYLNARPPPR